jgi:hypothetical protein
MTQDREMPNNVIGDATYAMGLANSSYSWYRLHAIRTRRVDRTVEVAIIAVSAAIPVAASISPHSAITPAVLGAVTLVLSSMRAVFHWHENYLRFSRAREAIEHERRLYYTKAGPYEDPATRERLLAQAVTDIEREEMGTWIRIASEQPGRR